jgi:hypothetical protein
MAFKHKISRRLALLRDPLFVVLAALVSGCMDASPLGSDLDSPDAPSGLIAIRASSDNPTIAPDQPTVVRAVGITASGQQMPVDADWVAVDGGILRDTLINSKRQTYFTAVQPGTYRLIGYDRGKQFRDTTRVTVPPTQLVSLTKLYIVPAAVSLVVGQGQQFYVYGRTSAGDSVAVVADVQAATGGETSGLYYTAGDTPGSYGVTVKEHDGALTAAATVNVAAASQAPAAPSAPSAPSAPTTPSAPATPASPVSSDMVPPELPRVYLDTRMVAPTGRTIVVPAGANLQTALNIAQRGDLIQLAAGATYTGNFILPAKSGSGWVTIQTATTLPGEGTRVTPSAAAHYAKIITPNSAPAIAVADAPSASQYRLVGVEVTSSASMTYSLVMLHSSAARTSDAIPEKIILDRVYVHGTPQLQLQRCVILNGRSSAVIDSWLSDCHAKGMDSQVIVAWNTPGPLKIVNNYLEGAGENVLFGGADPTVRNVIPSDIEIRHNYFYKPLSWKGVWTVKNLFESKSSQRVLLEGNVFENTWADGQDAAWVLKSQNQSGNCTWCETSDYTIQWNRVTNVPKLMVLTAMQYIPDQGGRSQPASRIAVTNNLCEQCGQENRWTLQIGGGLTDVVIAGNTMDGTRSPVSFSASLGGEPTDVDFIANVMTNGTYGILGDSRVGLGALETYCPTCQFRGNAIVGGKATSYPAGNYMITSASALPAGVGVNTAQLTNRVADVLPH